MADKSPSRPLKSAGEMREQRPPTESLEERVTRLLGEAHSEAQNGNIEGALELAAIAYEDWTGISHAGS